MRTLYRQMNPISPLLPVFFFFFIPLVLAQKFAPFIPVPKRHVTAPPPPTIKLLVCGDSITQGQEFDFTWRYRLWEWFRSNAAVDHLAPNLQYVGPYNGTLPKTETKIHQQQSPPRLEGAHGHDEEDVQKQQQQQQPTWGSYHPTTSPEFIGAHFALYGRPAWQVVDLLPTQVETYQPDIVVLHLGFNDIAWFGLKPAELVERMGWLVFRARLARRDVALLVADVSSRLLLEARQDLEGITIEYNNLLALKVEEWSTAESPVLLVKVREEYDCKYLSYCFDGKKTHTHQDKQKKPPNYVFDFFIFFFGLC